MSAPPGGQDIAPCFKPPPPPRAAADAVLVEFTPLQTRYLPARSGREAEMRAYRKKQQVPPAAVRALSMTLVCGGERGAFGRAMTQGSSCNDVVDVCQSQTGQQPSHLYLSVGNSRTLLPTPRPRPQAAPSWRTDNLAHFTKCQ